MTPSSSEFPRRPVQVVHRDCGNTFEVYAREWPPKIVVCSHCKVGLKLTGHDKVTGRLSYRHIT